MSKQRTLLSIAVACLFSSQASAYVYPGHVACPWADPSHSWVKFINGEYGGRAPYFSIRFSRDIGDIERNECYTISYNGNENWHGSGKIRNIRPHTSKGEARHGGDPAKGQINVWGAVFNYNEAGEVFYSRDGQLAGNLYCHIGSECFK